MTAWTTADIPSQAGKLAVITGATGGLGIETALELARAGAQVILTGRNDAKGRDAVARLRREVPQADVSYESLDLASLAAVAEFAARFASAHQTLDLLVNNAGVMALPSRGQTVDGFEMQLGTNYLGHYALTAHLLPQLIRASAPRVVSLSSSAHRVGRIEFDDLQSKQSYAPWKAYSQSKLAMLMFALELQRRSDAAGWRLMSNAAHPGWARTDLIANGPGTSGLMRMARLLAPLFGQSQADGAWPTLYAATSPEATAGGYYGPNGVAEMKGSPAPAKVMPQARDAAASARLWDVSEQLTGVSFERIAAAA